MQSTYKRFVTNRENIQVNLLSLSVFLFFCPFCHTCLFLPLYTDDVYYTTVPHSTFYLIIPLKDLRLCRTLSFVFPCRSCVHVVIVFIFHYFISYNTATMRCRRVFKGYSDVCMFTQLPPSPPAPAPSRLSTLRKVFFSVFCFVGYTYI